MYIHMPASNLKESEKHGFGMVSESLEIIDWLVVSTYPSEKSWSKSQLGFSEIPNMMGKSKQICSKPPTGISH